MSEEIKILCRLFKALGKAKDILGEEKMNEYFLQTTKGGYEIEVEKDPDDGMIYLLIRNPEGRYLKERKWDDVAENFF